jgi:hypothetical protein
MGGVEISPVAANRIPFPNREKNRMTTIRIAALVALPVAARAEAILEETSKAIGKTNMAQASAEASVGGQKFTCTPLGAKKK